MSVLSRIVGQFQWTPPAWLESVGVRRFGTALAVLLIAGLLGVAAWQHYLDKPQPARVVAQVVPPPASPLVDGKIVPPPLILNFSLTEDPRSPAIDITSVAALGEIGNELASGVSLKPAHPGRWRWRDESTLIFEPAADWPAGATYTVRWDASIFAPNLTLADTQARFDTAAFSASIDELSFYQDPVDTAVRKVVATVSFSHPVDAASLNDSLSYTMLAGDDTESTPRLIQDFTVAFDAQSRVAYVHSAPVTLPAVESYVTLTLGKKLKPAVGSASLGSALRDNVLIPDVGSYFKITDAQARIVRDGDDNPRQALTVEFTDRVATSAVAERVSAFLLPTSPIIDGRRVNNKRWQSAREVTAAILDQSTSVAVTLNPVEGDVASVHSAGLDLPENRTLYVKVDEGLRSQGKFVLATPYDTLVQVPAYPREATIAQSGAILPLSGSHQLTLIGRGVTTLKVEIGRLLDGQVNHLASQTRGDISQPSFRNWMFDEDNLTERTTRYIDVQPAHPSTPSFASLDMSEFLEQGGYFFVSVQGWDRARGYPLGESDRRFVLITDLGLLVKVNADTSQDVFVHSIATGEPVVGARVSLLGKNGQAVFDRVTNARGHASLPSVVGMKRERKPTVYVVRQGSDAVFMPFARTERAMQYSRFDVGGEYVQRGAASEQIRAQIFSDRGLYRPGDQVELGLIVKRDDWGVLDQLPLLLRITNPSGQLVLEEKRRLPDDGFFEQSFTTEAASQTGNYSVTLLLIEPDNRQRPIGSAAFKVEEFLPDRLRIRASIAGQKKSGWIQPGDLTTNVKLENLFGAAAQNRRIAGSLQLLPSSIRLRQFPEYRFVDPLRDPDTPLGSIEQALVDTTTDDEGRARLALDLARYDKGIYQLRVAVEGFEQGGGRSVKAVASAMLSPLDYLVGYRSDSDLAFLTKAAEHSVLFIAVDSNGDALDLTSLRKQLVEYRYVSTLVQRPNGTFAYQSVKKETLLSTDDYAITASGTELTLPTETPGSYAIKLMGEDGRVYSNVAFTVTGARNVAGNLERDAQLALSLNGDSFAPGDEIELSITAPFTGTGLITIERERVFAHKWFTADTNSTVQRIQVPPELEGNAYVNVAFIRALDSPEIFVSPLSYAVAPFAINRDARTLDLALAVPERVRPGEALNIDVTASHRSRVIVYAVDEGILQVARYTRPNPLDFFLRKIALQVSAYQMVDLILPQFEMMQRLAAPGGGFSAPAPGNNLNPFRRATEAPVTFWSGIVDTGPNGNRVTWQVPDYFDGSLKVMAVAVGADAVGSAQETTLVRGPFVLSPSVLTAAAPGDEFDVSVGVSNQVEGSVDNLPIEVAVSASDNLTVIGEATAIVALSEGNEGRVQFRVRALDDPGAASLSFSANADQESTRREATLSVRPSVAYTTTLEAGTTRQDSTTLQFERELYAAFADQSIAASASPLVLADGLLNYLEAFPHECAEQMVSKVFPMIGLLGNGDAGLDEASVRQSFAQTIGKLRARQTPEGGFRFWPAADLPARFPSVYITHFLTDAAAQGLPVPRAMRRAAVSFMKTLAAQEVTSLEQARVRAYAIYVLTRNDVVTTTYLTNLHEYLDAAHAQSWSQDLVASYMAASYAMLKQDRLAASLVDDYAFGGGSEMTGDFDTRLGRDAQYVYLLSRHFPERMARLDAATLRALIDPVMANRFNTLSSAYTILALGEYSKAVFRDAAAPLLDVTADNVTLVSDARFARARIDLAIKTVTLSGATSSPVFYALTQTGYDRSASVDPLTQGLELDRVYLNAAGEVVTAANIGDELTVRLRARSNGPDRSNVAIVDLLPGGFEVLTESVQRQFGGWTADYVDVREDRVVFYGDIGERLTEMQYRVKVTSSGDFTLPAAFGRSMYDRGVHARTAAGRFSVTPTP
ncbi:MAG: alpha-2-macroglobulin [Gammaproteobacteria bacterium]